MDDKTPFERRYPHIAQAVALGLIPADGVDDILDEIRRLSDECDSWMTHCMRLEYKLTEDDWSAKVERLCRDGISVSVSFLEHGKDDGK